MTTIGLEAARTVSDRTVADSEPLSLARVTRDSHPGLVTRDLFILPIVSKEEATSAPLIYSTMSRALRNDKDKNL